MATLLKTVLALALVLVIGVIGFQAVSHAQTINYGTGSTGVNSSGNTGAGTMNGANGTGTGTNGKTGKNGTTGTISGNGTRTATPGVPNTGAGGNAAGNVALLVGSALIAAVGMSYIIKEARA